MRATFLDALGRTRRRLRQRPFAGYPGLSSGNDQSRPGRSGRSQRRRVFRQGRGCFEISGRRLAAEGVRQVQGSLSERGAIVLHTPLGLGGRQSGANVSGQDMSKEFFDAIRVGDRDKVSAMLAADDTLLGDKDENGLGPFTAAKYSGRNQIAAMLLEKGVALHLFPACIAGAAHRPIESVVR